MKKDKKKTYKSVLSIIIWSFSEEIKLIPAVFFCTLLIVPVHVGLEYARVYLPSFVVAEVSSGHTLIRILLAVGGLMLLIFAGNLFVDFYGVSTIIVCTNKHRNIYISAGFQSYVVVHNISDSLFLNFD